MNKSDAEERLESHFIEAWVGQYPNNAYEFSNKNKINLERERGTMFIKVALQFPSSQQSAMVGSNSPHRVSGVMDFHIFTPSGGGSRASVKVLDFIEETFALKSISGIVFKSVQEVSRSDPEGIDLYRRSCAVNFTFDSFTP